MGIEAFASVLGAAQAGAEWALTILYREIHPKLLRYLASREPQEAEDLASEAWLDVAAGLDRSRLRTRHGWRHIRARVLDRKRGRACVARAFLRLLRGGRLLCLERHLLAGLGLVSNGWRSASDTHGQEQRKMTCAPEARSG